MDLDLIGSLAPPISAEAAATLASPHPQQPFAPIDDLADQHDRNLRNLWI